MYVLPKKATRTSILTLLVNMAFSKSTFIVCDILKTCQFIKNVPDEYYSSIHLTLSRSWRSKHAKNWYSGTIVNKLQVVNSTFFWTKTRFLQLEVSIRGISSSAAAYGSITLHTVVHGKTATKLKVKSGSLHQLEWLHSKETIGLAPVRG